MGTQQAQLPSSNEQSTHCGAEDGLRPSSFDLHIFNVNIGSSLKIKFRIRLYSNEYCA